MKVIVGLGNPGPKYGLTKHNVGFMLVNALAEKLGISETEWKDKFEALVAETRIGTEKVLLVKPMTYMNDSGRGGRYCPGTSWSRRIWWWYTMIWTYQQVPSASAKRAAQAGTTESSPFWPMWGMSISPACASA